ncbi:MAG: LLM class flavin-dependent oxidoreductase [Gammaproteobacteria bacterium]|nr:LLM class flavin-dependent oxidoreductase [Gammaproteobacteria bacterium]
MVAACRTAIRCVAAGQDQPSTLDQVSNGRFILGLGAGWFGTEYRAHGYPFPSTAERLAQLEETAVNSESHLVRRRTNSLAANISRINKAYNNPRPIQRVFIRR